MKKIEVIDLFNMVAKGDIPRKIKYRGFDFEYDKNYNDFCYFDEDDYYTYKLLEDYMTFERLEDEVEIIEEKNSKLEKLELVEKDNNVRYKSDTGVYAVRVIDIDIISKINEIIDKLNSMEDKQNG